MSIDNSITALCPHCSEHYELDSSAIGQIATCNNCENDFKIEVASIDDIPISLSSKKNDFSDIDNQAVTLSFKKPKKKISAKVTKASQQSPVQEKKQVKRTEKKKSKAPLFLVPAALAAIAAGAYFTLVKPNSANADSSLPTVEMSSEEKDYAEKAIIVPQEELPPAFSQPFINGQPDYPNIARPNNFGVIELVAGIGKAEGGLKHHKWTHFSDWNSPKHAALWEVEIPKAGEYEIRYNGALAEKNPENRIEVSVAGQTVSSKVVSTGDWRKYRQHSVGTINFDKAGKFTLKVKGNPIKPGTHLMDLKAVSLHPTNTPRSFDFIENKWDNEVPHMYRADFGFNVGSRPYDKKMERKGYAIFTTKNLQSNLKELKNFVAHKEALGFKVHVVTEDQFGGGRGPTAVKNIREWLKNNTEKLDLLYVLMLGDSDPRDGTIPTAMVQGRGVVCLTPGQNPEDVLPGTPSDVPFGDFDQSEDSKFKWDVLVGRIPYFGEKSHDGKMVDVDAILRKTIDYENEKNINYRYSFGLDGTSWMLNSDLMETAGINYISRDVTQGSYIQPMDFVHNNTHFLANNVVGYQRTGGHANANFIEGGLSRGSIRDQLTNRPQTVKEYGGCSCATPEFECHLAYVHLRYQAVAVLGATRSISTLGGHSLPFMARFKFDILNWGSSVGYAQWRSICNDAQTRRNYHGGNVMLMLLGDPSVRPFPHGLKTSYQAKVRPVHNRSFQVNNAEEFKGKTFEFDIESNTPRNLYWSAKSQADWITLSKHAGKISKDGERFTFKATVNDNVKKLEDGDHLAEIKIMANGHEQSRKILLKVESPQLETYHTLDDFKGKQTFSILDSSENYPIISLPRGKNVNPENHTKGLQGKAINPAKLGTELPLSQNIKVFDSATLSFWIKWQDEPKSTAILTQGRREKEALLDYDAKSKKLKVNLRMEGFAGTVSWIDFYNLNTVIEAPFQAKENEWYELSLAFDRQKHTISIFANGKLLKEESTDPRLAFDLRTQISPKLDALVDNLSVSNYPLNAKEALAIYEQGHDAKLLNPKSGSFIDHQNVNLQFLTGGTKVKDYQVRVADSKEALDSAKAISSKVGKVSLAKLDPLKEYFCRIDRVMNDSSVVKGEVQTFGTSQNLLRPNTLHNLDDWKTPQGKKAATTINNHFVFYGPTAESIQTTKTKVVPNRLYTFEVTALPQDFNRTIKGQIFVSANGKETLVAEKVFDGRSGPRQVHYYGEKAHEGQNIAVKLVRHEIDITVTNVKLIASNAPRPNMAPEIDSSVIAKVYKYNVKNNTPVYDLFKNIKDPDGDKYTIVKLEGPNWVDIRGEGSLFTPFGPPKNAVGEHEMKFKVTDSNNNSTTFSLKIKVDPAK